MQLIFFVLIIRIIVALISNVKKERIEKTDTKFTGMSDTESIKNEFTGRNAVCDPAAFQLRAN